MNTLMTMHIVTIGTIEKTSGMPTKWNG